MPSLYLPYSDHKASMKVSVVDANGVTVESWEMPTGTPTLNVLDKHMNGDYTITAQLLTSGGQPDPTTPSAVLKERTAHVKQVPAASGQEPASGPAAGANSTGARANDPKGAEPASKVSQAAEHKAEPVGEPATHDAEAVTHQAEPTPTVGVSAPPVFHPPAGKVGNRTAPARAAKPAKETAAATPTVAPASEPDAADPHSKPTPISDPAPPKSTKTS